MNHGHDLSDDTVAALLRLPDHADPEHLVDALSALGYNQAHLVALRELHTATAAGPTEPAGEREGYLSTLGALAAAIKPWLRETGVQPDEAFLWHVSFAAATVPEEAHEWLRLTPLGWLAHAAGYDPDGYAETEPTPAALWAQVALSPTPAAARLMRVIPILTDPVLLEQPLAVPVSPTW